MAVKIVHSNGDIEIIPKAVDVRENPLFNSYDFYDKDGAFIIRVHKEAGLEWLPAEEPTGEEEGNSLQP